ncbi:MAG: YjcQ family protein [Clostridia bacterium]|nr:YjcQ family protein [Clostridia bacterium]
MDNFKAVYKILSALEKAMDLPEFDLTQIGPEKLGVSRERWARYLEMMADVGYIKGISIQQDILGETVVRVSNIRITLKGLEYLQENTLMRKIYNAARGITEVIPGM